MVRNNDEDHQIATADETAMEIYNLELEDIRSMNVVRKESSRLIVTLNTQPIDKENAKFMRRCCY